MAHLHQYHYLVVNSVLNFLFPDLCIIVHIISEGQPEEIIDISDTDEGRTNNPIIFQSLINLFIFIENIPPNFRIKTPERSPEKIDQPKKKKRRYNSDVLVFPE